MEMHPPMDIGLSERWILLADVSNSTHFFWELMQAGRQKPDALFKGSSIYSANMESIFGQMANICSDRLVAHLGNTMGDGFILVGRHGHGADHIKKDAPRVLQLASRVKTESDRVLADTKQGIGQLLNEMRTPRTLPDIKMKVTLHHGFVVTMMRSQRFFGDTVNYCARIASAAFEQWHEGVVITKSFLEVLPEVIQRHVEPLETIVKIRYPARESTTHLAYRLSTSSDAIWSKVNEIAC
jgi:class 3 adenylate cyclase